MRSANLGPGLAGSAPPIDPDSGLPLALAGRVVTMNTTFEVIDPGVVYIHNGEIVAVQAREAPVPAGFETVPLVDTRGTLYPGLIELHNHLSYDALPLWDVPKAYTNRDTWAGTAEYRRLITGPMTVIGKTPALVAALIRYVECKCLLGGVTTTQGIMLASNAGVRRYYRGLVRNVEQTNDAALPEAATRIADVDAQNATWFLNRLKKQSCFLLHLAEGIDDRARAHFLALQIQADEWAITRQLAGIHCAGLKAPDFEVFAQRQGAMIWSPLSNLLLYGKTAEIKAAKAAGMRFGMGSDWSPSGSKNLLGELKVAKIYNEMVGGVFSDRDLVTMVTTAAAGILQWQNRLGSLQPGRRADLLIIKGRRGDPYSALIHATESDLVLVLINGVARYGTAALMNRLSPDNETIRLGGYTRKVCLVQDGQEPDVSPLSLASATQTLRDALHDLPHLAKAMEEREALPRSVARRALDEPEPVTWLLALDELYDTGVDMRPRLPFGKHGDLTGPTRAAGQAAARAAVPLSTILQPIQLDALTVLSDADFLDRIAHQRNLPEEIKEGLTRLF